ncbi:MAG: ELWxxDGT repeat protein [Bacteroidota bacterium]
MKKSIPILLGYIITFLFSDVSAQNLSWVKGAGGLGFDGGTSICTDVSCNVYTTGYFENTVDFDPGTGVFNLTSFGSTDIFVLKTDASGNFVWAKSIGGAGGDGGNLLCLDASGNILITGDFSATTDFDPGVGLSNLTSVDQRDVFILKLNSSGDFVWVKSIGGTGNDQGASVAVDASGNILITGIFYNTVDFDPGSGVNNITSTGQADFYIAKLDASGNLLWVKTVGGTNNEYGYSIATDAAGGVFLTGVFFGLTTDFDPGAGVFNLTSTNTSGNIFILKLDSSGNWVWAKSFGASGYDLGLSIAIDASSNVYTTGWYENTVDFDPGSGVFNLTSNGSLDVFISKLDASGNFVWAKSIGGSSSDQGADIVIDPSGDVYTIGGFTDLNADFDPGSSIVSLSAAGGSDIFVSKLDDAGNFLWAKALSGTGFENASGVATDISGNIYLTGSFEQTVDFDPNAGVVNINAIGVSDIFLLKMSSCTTTQPGPISGNNSVNPGDSETYSVASVTGATSYIWTLPSVWSGSSTTNSITVVTGTAGGTLSVSAVNTCGTSISSTFAVTVTGPTVPASECSPALFKDLRPGYSGSYPINFRELNGTLYFSNYDGLWKTNGTETGTIQIQSFSDLKEIEVLNNNLIFSVPSPNWQLRKSDGTGTTLIKEFPNATNSDGIFNLTYANGFIFFTVNENYVRKLWRTDGTEAGTILVKDIDPTNYTSYSPGGYFEFNNNIYFNAGTSTTGQELWKSDGTEAGTTIVKDIKPGVGSGHTNYGVYAILNNELYFYANDGSQYGLWKTDGSDAGTSFIKECLWINEISTINNVLYFSAYDIGANTGNTLYGEELWKSDGTPTGTYMVKDIYPGQSGSKQNNYQFKAVNSTIVFSAKDGINGVELWKTDGTETGTTLLKNINPDVINAQIGLSSSIVFNGYLYFSANNGTTGGELWKTDGTMAGTALVADLYPGTDGSSPFDFTVFNGNLFFRAESGSAGVELWSCVAATSSVSEVESENIISVFPNPANDFITIENKNAKLRSAYVIFNAIGQQVLRGKLTGEKTTVDISHLQSGFYLFQIGETEKLSFKLLKK